MRGLRVFYIWVENFSLLGAGVARRGRLTPGVGGPEPTGRPSSASRRRRAAGSGETRDRDGLGNEAASFQQRGVEHDYSKRRDQWEF